MIAYRDIVNFVRQFKWLRDFIWWARQSYYRVLRHIFIRKPIINGSHLIAEAIEDKKAFMAGKMGSVEAAALHFHFKRLRKGKQALDYSNYAKHTLNVNAGVFPADSDTYDRFCQIYLSAVEKGDALVAWDVAGESEVFPKYCSDASLIEMRNLEPYFSDRPWSQAMAGKKILVISPFAKTIESQYQKREEIWPDKNVLPHFDLLTIKAPLSAGLVTPKEKDWFESLENLKNQMDAYDYDVVLIGAGAFSLPLAAHAKANGKVGIHLGGALQILFGVIGKRWREHPDFKTFITDAWVAPSEEETPSDFKKIEGGCYW